MIGETRPENFIFRSLMESIFKKKKPTVALKASEVDMSDIDRAIDEKMFGKEKKKKKNKKKKSKPVPNQDKELCREDGGDEDNLAELELNDAYCSPFTGAGLGRYANSDMDDEVPSDDDDDFNFDDDVKKTKKVDDDDDDFKDWDKKFR